MTIVKLPLAQRLSASSSSGNPWAEIASQVTGWLASVQVDLDDVIVLLPFAQLLPLARRAFARVGGWMPRIETTWTLATSLGPLPVGQVDQVSFDVTLDQLVAARLLRADGDGVAWERRDPRGFERAATALVATAHDLLRSAAAVAPQERDVHWAAARSSLVPASGPGGLERVLARLALEWAIPAPAPLTDRLFELRPKAWVVVRAGGADALAERLLEESLAPALLIDTDVDDALPFERLPAGSPPCRAVCESFEEEAQCTAAQVVAHLRRGEAPVALIAQDRVLVRRVRALLERDGIALLDETGWRLSTTRAAALVMNLLRAARVDASADALLDWLKALPDRDARFASAVASFERLLRRKALAGSAAIGDHFAEVPPESSAAQLWQVAALVLTPLGTPPRRTLSDWLAALVTALGACEAWEALARDDAGSRVLAALHLGDDRLPDGARGSAWESASQATSMSLAAFTGWVDSVLERERFMPSASVHAEAQVVVTPLARAILRPFAAAVLPGADERHLGAPEPGHALLSDAQARALGVPDAAARRRVELLAFSQLLRVPRLTFLRRRHDDGEALAESPLVARLALALQRAEGALAEWRDPRIPHSRAATPIRASAPRTGPQWLPERLSATACEALRACPYKFFGLNMLGLSEEDELDGELEKRDYGTWLHSVLHAFHAAREKPDSAPAEIGVLLALARSSRQGQGLPEADFLPFLASFESLAPRYIAWLHTRDAAGWAWQAGETELTLQLPGLGGVTLRGIIDRIDVGWRDGARITELIDYKTGNAGDLRIKVRRPLEDTQLAFYAALVGGPAPLEATYLALDGGKRVEPIGHPDVQTSAMALLDGLAGDLRRVREGVGLAPLGSGADCTWCAARGLCRRDHWSAVVEAEA